MLKEIEEMLPRLNDMLYEALTEEVVERGFCFSYSTNGDEHVLELMTPWGELTLWASAIDQTYDEEDNLVIEDCVMEGLAQLVEWLASVVMEFPRMKKEAEEREEKGKILQLVKKEN